MIFDNVLLI